MANLRNLAGVLATGGADEIAARLHRRSDLLSVLAERLGASAWPHLEAAERIVTISRSSAVAAVLDEARRRGWSGEIVVFDGSAAGRGRDQAAALARRFDGVRSQPDAMMPRWLDGDAVRVVIGADAVSPLRLVNACGTRALLELAAARSVPVFVVADTGKNLPEPEIDELAAAEPQAEENGPRRRWPIFEIAPMARVTQRLHE
jgi:translation initiation factor 2B subunit (eIF-2B alpha/beta/delta family)